MDEALKIVADNPGGALQILRTLDRAVPSGLLLEERKGCRILALVKLGRKEEARNLFAAFKLRYRKSPYIQELEEALQAGPAPAREKALFSP